MYIYKILNLINNKIYIGQSIDVKRRFNRHINDALKGIEYPLYNDIRLYGAKNFIIDIIDEASNQEELNYKESYWINFYNSINPDIGYNQINTGFRNGGNTYQLKSNEEMSIIKNKIRLTKMGSNNPNSKKIKCLNVYTGEELFFDTVKDCQIYFNENTHRFITTRVTNQTRSLYKNTWTISYINDNYKFKYNVSKRGTRINVNNGFIDITYNSITKFCSDYNINRKIITDHIVNGELSFNINDNKITILD